MIKPYPYQASIIVEAYKKLLVTNRVAIVAPTGSGKTIIAAFITKDAVKRHRRVLFVVHRDRLIPQTQKALLKLGIKSGVIAGRYSEDRSRRVQIASFQTMSGDRDISWFKPELTIADECHITNFVGVIGERFPKLTQRRNQDKEGFLIGLTATPWRLSKYQSLGDYYEEAVFAPMPKQLIEQGFLTPMSYYHVPDEGKGNVEATVTYLIEQWRTFAQNRLTIAFCPTIDFANSLARGFEEIGVLAKSVHSKMPIKECDRIYKDYEAGKIKVLSSVGKLTEGFDVPAVSCGILARDTESKSLYFQMLGRIARKSEGKNDAILLDAIGLSHPSRFGRFEDLEVSEESFLQSDRKQKGEAPMKVCYYCFAEILACYRVCPCCKQKFEIDRPLKELPTGRMIRYWVSNEEKVQYAVYQRLLKAAYHKEQPPEWAGQKFLEKFNYLPPLDWRRNSVLIGATAEQQKKYKNYLQKVAKLGNLGQEWVWEQLCLELGV